MVDETKLFIAKVEENRVCCAVLNSCSFYHLARFQPFNRFPGTSHVSQCQENCVDCGQDVEHPSLHFSVGLNLLKLVPMYVTNQTTFHQDLNAIVQLLVHCNFHLGTGDHCMQAGTHCFSSPHLRGSWVQ